MTPRTRVLRFLGLATLPLVALGAVFLGQTAERHRRLVERERLLEVQTLARTVELYVSGSLVTIRTLAMSPVLTGSRDPEVIQANLERFLEANPHWQGVGLIGPDGRSVAGTSSRPGQIDISDRPYFQEMQRTRRAVVSDAIIGRASGQPSIIVLAPVPRPDGTGGLLAALPRAHFASYLSAVQQLDGHIQVQVVDRAGQLVFPLEPRQVERLQAAPSPEARLQHSTSYVDAERGLLVAQAPVPAYGWAVVTTQPLSAAYSPVRDWIASSAAALGLAVLLVLAMGWLVGGRLSRATEELEEARRAAEAAGRRMSLLAEVSRRVAAADSERQALLAAGGVAVPGLAPAGAVWLEGEEDEALTRLAILGGPGERPDGPSPPDLAAATAAELEDRGLLALTLKEGRPEVVSLSAGRTLLIPLLCQRGCRAALGLTSPAPDAFDAADVDVAADLGRRVALAIDELRLRDELAQAVRTRERILHTVSHDLRGPLGAIRLRLQALLLGAAKPDALPSSLRRMDAQAVRMGRMIDDLLDAARGGNGGGVSDLDHQPVDLVEVVRKAVDEHAELTDRHRFVLDASELVVGLWDGGRIERVVGNLLDNAVKYSPDGGEIRLRVAREGEHAVLEVQDSGIGIPEADLARLFHDFYRAENTRGLPGTGLGLASVRSIVEQHGGAVTAASREGEGSRFTVRLPLEPAAMASAASPGRP